MKLKYLIVRVYKWNNTSQIEADVAVLFPSVEGMSHRDVASLHSASRHAVIAAGFCEINHETKKVEVFGESETLPNKSVRSEDALIIAQLFGW